MARKIDPLIIKFEKQLAELSTAPDVDVMAAATNSPAIHFALFCRILDDNNEVISPQPNILQLRMCEAFETLRALGVRIRIIVTKPRRAGCSSFVEHIGYHTAMLRPIEGITIADDSDGSTAAMKKLQSYAKYDSFPWGVRMIQDVSKSVAWDNGSKWTVDTARNKHAGAGDTRQFGHMSETSKWPQTTSINDFKTMTCVMPSLSGIDTAVFSESTPEGAAGWQYQTWSEGSMTLPEFLALWDKGHRPEEVWIRVFAAWFEFPSNRRRNPCSEVEIEMLQETLNDHERDEMEKYDLDWEQISWRRETIQAKCGGCAKTFSYYYPSDPVSCWLTSGSPRFDMQQVLQMAMTAGQALPDTGYLVTQELTKKTAFVGQRDGSGDIHIWEHPRPGLSYLVALDPATNASQTVSKDPDRHSLSVWRRGYHEQASDRWFPAKRVARLRPPWTGEDDEIAGHCVRLSRYYGTAMVAMEVNIGQGILRLLQIAGVPLYKRRPMSHRTGKVEEQYGFKMSSNKDEREALISGLASAISAGDIDPSCLHAIAEYKSFIRNSNGKSEAALGKHDDDVMCDAIAWECLPSASPFRLETAKIRDPKDRGVHGWRSSPQKW